jgi:hypothetical protein
MNVFEPKMVAAGG